MQPNDILCGFRVVSARQSAENRATLWELQHLKTGAPLYWFDNGDENKTFSVAFKTVPWDDTGVFHILEHSVLCGSQKYPVREPFVELLKSSMQTFLNAMTFQDKTMYPVSSRSEQDFLNLTDVYLDAVFHPLLLENPSIFLQEGTRIDFEGDAPSFNGVVFNEMKGATSSMTAQAFAAIRRLLFPDTCYGYVSGGAPEAIPTLSYKAFTDAYRTFYHPSNAVFYLDGAVPTERTLTLIDGYLDAFERDGTPHPIPDQTPVAGASVRVPYQIGEGEPAEKKTCAIYGKQTCPYEDVTRLTALDVLRGYLFDSNFSPVKKAVMDTGLAEDVAFINADGNRFPFAAVLIINTEEQHVETLRRVIRDAALAVADAPADTEALLAEIDKLALQLKEADEPQGIDRAIDLLSSRLYGGDPLLYLEHDAVIADLRQKAHTGYFADLIRDFFADEDVCLAVLTPDASLGKRKAEEEQRQLEAMLSSLTPEQRAAKEAEFAAFKTWQDTPDSEEALLTLPRLTLADVPPEGTAYLTEEKTEDGVTVRYHPRRANGVVYPRLFFDCGDLLPEDLPPLAFASKMFTELPTEKHDVETLNRLLKRCTGWFSASLLTVDRSRRRTGVVLAAACSALPEKLPEALELIPEILTQTLFDDKKRVSDLLTQERDRIYRSVCGAGSRYATLHALSHTSAEMAADDRISGLEYYFWLKAFEKDFDARFEGFCACVRGVLSRVCVRERMTVSLTADDYHPAAASLFAAFPSGAPSKTEGMSFDLPEEPQKEAFVIPGGVSFAALGADLRAPENDSNRSDGLLHVMGHILTYDYLWNEIRVRGGAYGCGSNAYYDFAVKYYTYRDPDPVRSLDVIGRSGEYLASFCASEGDIDNYIISSVASCDPLEPPWSWGMTADMELLRGRTAEDRLAERRQMLATTKEKLLSCRPLLEEAARRGCRCIVGAKEALDTLDGSWKIREI